MSWTQKAKCYVLALFAYVNEQSGIFLKIFGQNTSSSPSISLRFIESKQIQNVEEVKEIHEKYSIRALDCALRIAFDSISTANPRSFW